MVSPLNRRLKFVPILFFILAVSCQLTAVSCFAQSPQHIRVAIIQDTASLRLKINGFYEIIDPINNKILYRGKNLNTTVTACKDGILLGGLGSKPNKLLINPSNCDAIVIDGRMFRGSVRFIKRDNSRLLVVNYIDLEDYIKGILYHEASHYWPLEALKAQAVVCRSYAVYQMQENKLKDYDVTSDIYSQVYGGRTSERYRPNIAVDETKGQMLTYQDKVFPAYFHATCGGHTEDASMLWNINIAPLRGVACNFCKASPHFRWHYVLTLKEIEDILTEAGRKVSHIKDIIILNRDGSGRIINLKISSNEKDLMLSAKDFRNIIGPNIIRSTNFRVNIVNQDAVFEGFGWGHGVGLCQWGAYFMAKQRYNYEKILKYYYPQSDVKTIGF